MDGDGEDGKCTSSSCAPESEPGPKPEAVAAPESPSFSVQLPSPQCSLEEHPDLESPFGKICGPPQARTAIRTQND